MKLMFSKNGKPYIEVGDVTLIFSSVGMKNDCYKYITFSKKTVTTVTTSGAKAKKKKTVSISENLNGCFNMNLRKSTAPNDIKKIVPPLLAEFLRKSIKKYLIGDFFPKNKINDLKNDIEKEYDETDLIDDDSTAIESYD